MMNTGKIAQTAYERALKMIDEGAPRREILTHLATTAERASIVTPTPQQRETVRVLASAAARAIASRP